MLLCNGVGLNITWSLIEKLRESHLSPTVAEFSDFMYDSDGSSTRPRVNSCGPIPGSI